MSLRPLSARWWISDREGNVALVHWPNPALAVWLLSIVVSPLVEGDRASTLAWVGKGALVVWALDEVVRGSSPARRVLGGVVLLVQLARLFG